MNIQEKTLHFLKKHNILQPNMPIIVGFSGGQDSLCLLDILKDISELKIIAAHLNHNWRAEESKKEQCVAFEYCKKHNIEFFTKTLDATEKKTELEARNQRYKFFKEACLKHSSSLLLTAHTKTDNTETILYRIIKGTGIHGIKGVPEVREEKNYTIYRPMLDISREETEAYCRTKKLTPASDSSNFEDKYARNNLRLNIIPKLKEINPKFDDAIGNLCAIAKDYEQALQNTMPIEEITTNEFVATNEPLQRIMLHKFLMKNEINYGREKITQTLTFIKDNSRKPCGKKLSLTTDKWLFVNTNEISIVSKTKPETKKSIFIERFQGEFEQEQLKLIKNNDTKILANLPYPSEELEIRTRKNGDTIQPFGMSGTMKLKKFFINKAVAEHMRDDILLLTHKNEVLWVTGIGISEKLRVTDRPSHIIELREMR